MDKNTIIGFVLIGLVLFGFSWLNRPTPEQIEAQRRYQDSIARIEQIKQNELAQQNADPMEALAGLPDSVRMARLQTNFGSFASKMSGTEEFVTLENEKVSVVLSTKGGRAVSATLKEYDNYEGKPLVLFEDKESVFDLTFVTAANQVVNTRDLYFTPIQGSDANALVMRLALNENSYIDFSYTLAPDDYKMDFKIQGTGMNGLLSPNTQTLHLNWTQDIRQQEKGRSFEDRYVELHYKVMGDDVDYLSASGHANKTMKEDLHWIGFKDMYFSTVLVAKNGFQNAKLDSRPHANGQYLKTFNATADVPFDLLGTQPTDLQFYFIPNKFALLSDYNDNLSGDDKLHLEKLVPLGWGIFRWVNQFFVIPLFDFLGKYINNYGWLIFLLTVIVKLILYPLTYKSYMSSAKMRVLRPQVEEINAKYPEQEQAMERQRQIMELYSRAGASPMSGCIPLLLQMPILIALFMFFPSAIELRHESFLWAQDLSTYDAIISWDVHIPLISTYFGNHISLFCLLMTITNIVYTKYNMEMTNTGQQQMPGMKLMMYLMPLMFLFIFNSYASGLTYYYFISTLITIAQTLVFRFTINEEKLLAKLEANKRKPLKKSGFMKRLEEAQRMQEEQLKRQQEQRRAQQMQQLAKREQRKKQQQS